VVSRQLLLDSFCCLCSVLSWDCIRNNNINMSLLEMPMPSAAATGLSLILILLGIYYILPYLRNPLDLNKYPGPRLARFSHFLSLYWARYGIVKALKIDGLNVSLGNISCPMRSMICTGNMATSSACRRTRSASLIRTVSRSVWRWHPESSPLTP
jgi:hypothetical protein